MDVVRNAQKIKKFGLPIGTKLVLTFLSFVLVLSASLVVVYQQYIPALVMKQIELRTYSVAQSFGGSVLEPLVVNNYLRVNKIAESTAKLPGVAYAAVISKKGIPVAGIFSNLERFEENFAQVIKNQGFPSQLLEKNPLQPNAESSLATFMVGGQEINEVAIPVGNSGAQARIGIFTSDVKKSLQETLIPLFSLLGIMAILGSVLLAVIARTVSRPIKQLAFQANEISLGHVDQNVEIKGGGEIRELADAFKRMHASVKYSMSLLNKSADSED